VQDFALKVPIDEVSWEILCALQENARLTYSELGRRVGLTPPAVAERVKRLEEAGVITGYRAELDLSRLGLTLTAIIRLAPRGRPSNELGARMAALPEVLECHHVTGEDCFVMKVAVASVGHLEQLLARLQPHGETTTSVVLSSPVTHRVVGPPTVEQPRVAPPATNGRGAPAASETD
jgi:Lrp/AsnC family transcriptional regulator, leucine-responsive regulatory protein